MRKSKSTRAGSNLHGWLTALAPAMALAMIIGCQSTTANEEATADASPPASTDPAGKLAVVDGKTVLAHEEDASILGGGHDKVGLYCYTTCKIRNVKVYVKTVVEELGLE